MSAEQATSDKFSRLRRQAEAIVAQQPQTLGDYSPEELQRLAHELNVHRVELEQQNEELRYTQLARELAQKNYAALYDSAPVGYITLDEGGLMVEANLTIASLLDVDRSSLIGARLARFVAAEEQEAYHFYCRRLFKSQTPQRGDLKLVKKDSSLFYARLEGRVVPAELEESQTGGAPAGQGGPLQQARIIISDITRERQAEEHLRQSQARLDGIISTATDAIITIDAGQRITLFNMAAEQMFRYKAGQVIGQPLDLLLPERFQAAHRQYVDQFGQTGATARRMGLMPDELWGRRASGQEFPIEAMISQVTVAGQKFYTVILRDITERRRNEEERARLFKAVSDHREELRALAAQLADVQEAERRELARELHDRVGQNLTALGLNLNLIWSRLAETPVGVGPVQSYLDDAQALVEQMAESVRDVMADLRPPLLDEYGLVAALRWYGRRLAAQAGLALRVVGTEPSPRLAMPVESALFRIAQEALTNVAKHAQPTQVTVTVETSEGATRLTIADDGAGFDPAAVVRPANRSGVGLLSIRERAEAVGGHCRIESSPGQGTRVIVEVGYETR